MAAERFAIHDSRPSPEMTWQRPQIQTFIQIPRITGNDPGAVSAHVFRETLLRRMTYVKATEIDSDGKRTSFFQTTSDG